MNRIEELSVFKDDIYTCNRTRCGFCREECPVYRIKGYETYSCRGKMLVARGLLEGLLRPSEEMTEMLDSCLLCGYCQARCALRNVDIITVMRQEMVREGFASKAHQENTDRIIKEGRLFEAQVLSKREGEIPVYIGCLYRSRPRELSTIFSVLERLNIYPQVGEESCCGYLVEATGFPEAFEKAKEHCRRNLNQQKEGATLTLCPTCTITLKEKYEVPVQPAIVAVHQKLKEAGIAHQLKPLNLKVTYHDPCHLGRMLGIFEEPREILQQLGVDLIEMEHNRYFSTCCGGGGGLRAVDDLLSIEIAKNRIRDALNVGAETIITVCPTCESTLLRASGRLTNEIDRFIDVRTLWDLLDMSLTG
ncbi:MAG: (Fe-S)-binding protein [Thermodesulfobacteriota bacterium]